MEKQQKLGREGPKGEEIKSAETKAEKPREVNQAL
jgi:hypothetical protein